MPPGGTEDNLRLGVFRRVLKSLYLALKLERICYHLHCSSPQAPTVYTDKKKMGKAGDQPGGNWALAQFLLLSCSGASPPDPLLLILGKTKDLAIHGYGEQRGHRHLSLL